MRATYSIKPSRLLAAWVVPAVCAVIVSASAEIITIDVDSVYPSGGSGYDGPIPPPTTVEIEVPASFEPAPLVTSVATPGSNAIGNIGPSTPPSPATPTASFSFDGISQVPTLDGLMEKPPDTHIAVGTGAGAAGRVVEVTNNGVAIWDKTGAVVAPAGDLDAFIVNSGSPITDFGFDPKIIFDQHSGRFFIVVLDGKTATQSNLHIFVSTNNTPNTLDSTSWTAFKDSAITNFGGANTWFDYPGFGADSSRLVVTGNMFDGSSVFRGAKIRVYDKAALIGGASAFTDFDISAAATTGASTIQPAHTYGTTDSGNFYLVNRFGSTAYRLWEIGGTAASPTLIAGAGAIHAWTSGAQINAGAPQSGVTGITIDTLSARLMQAVYRAGSVWCVVSADADSDSKTEVVWFEILTNGGNPSAPTVRQSGFINGSDGDEWTFMPSININAAGDALICYSQSFTDQFVDMRVVSRAAADPLSTFRFSVVVRGSAGEYDGFNASNPERWGDYSAAVIDPDDDATFWVANEYCRVGRASGDDAEWGTWIAKMDTTSVALPAGSRAVSAVAAALLLLAGVARVLRARE